MNNLSRRVLAPAGATSRSTSGSILAYQHDISPFIIGQHRGRPFDIPLITRLKHALLLGATGSGKSTAVVNMIAQDLAAGRGVALIDPHGDHALQVLGLIPPARAHELVYLDVGDLERPIGFNPLDVPADQRITATEDILAAFIHVFGRDAIQGRSQQILRNALRALMCTPRTSLLAVPRLLTDDEFRAHILKSVDDPIILGYWHGQ